MTFTGIQCSNSSSTSNVSNSGMDENYQTENQTNEDSPAPGTLTREFIYDLTRTILCDCDFECNKCTDGRTSILHSIKCDKRDEPCTIPNCELIRETLTKWFINAYPEKDSNTGMQTFDIYDLKDLVHEAATVALVLFKSETET